MAELEAKIIGAITVLPEKSKRMVWEFIEDTFGADDNLSDEELKAIQGYMNGDEEYQPYMTHEEVKKELGL